MPQTDNHRRAVEREQSRVAEQLDELIRQREQLVEAMTADNADDEHDPEGATLAWERENLTALIASMRTRGAALAATATRLDDGWPGTCETCGRTIPTARIIARPEATRCVQCASRGSRPQ